MKIVTLTENEISSLKQLYGDIHFNDIKLIDKFFVKGALDRFNRILSEEEAQQLLTNKYQNRLDETNYINCFNKIFELCAKQEVYVHCADIFHSSVTSYKRILPRKEYRYILLLKQVIKGEFIRTNDRKVLEFLFRLSLDTSSFSNFFFPSISTVIIGNYDMSFPVFCKDHQTITKLENIAHTSGLYIRR
ncbi:hypothetical protein MT476_17360 [Bacillus sp. H8-1]|uniref:hypothetical protein n=1 Tax=Priestia aryabhattai TaxID=412384 RepID=UPI00064E47FB|nr:hypothetical protein [Priestia aryabhattai]KML24516.1 hypothetical protein VL11_26030 [Priestia aryabhattai]KMN98182.1 hypothetical protein ABV89_18495 [Priestia aryabhattai]UPK48441.1 hypothetical protein MT476_17360 [Bacillus sp. H8-1]